MCISNSGRRVRILVIDDNSLYCDALSVLLDHEEYLVMSAFDGPSGVQRAGRDHPDLILLDVMMRGMDGFETCRQLKTAEATRHIPVIFMTALADRASQARGYACGAADYLPKPFQLDELLDCLTTTLNKTPKSEPI